MSDECRMPRATAIMFFVRSRKPEAGKLKPEAGITMSSSFPPVIRNLH